MKKMSALLLLLFATGASAQQKEGTIYMVSNAHFDSQWNWDVQTSIGVYVRNTLTQNLWLLEHYPDYVFNFEGGIKYSWMKEYYPEKYERIKEYIKSGRWHVSGASWDATDPNMPSTESFFRNILLGQEFYKLEFGVKSTDIFLPDCFGFGYTLPTVASHCGLIGFSTQKLQWRTKPFYGDSKVPFLFGIWEGIDGSRIIAALDARDYVKRYSNGDVSVDPEIIDIVSKSPNRKGYRYYGTGDMGGSPTILSVEAVEGGIHNGKGAVNVVSATSDQLFKEYLPMANHPELPVYKGELLMDVHATGCYTSQGIMKRFNRRNEQLADAAERASVMADWLGGTPYPTEKLNEAWKRFVWHQFHDDLTGTSIPRAYTFSWNDELLSQSQFNDILTHASATVSRGLDTRAKGVPVVVFNPLAQTRRDLVHAKIPMDSKPAGVEAYSPAGQRIRAQILSYENGVAEVIFPVEMGPASYTVYDIRKTSPSASGVLRAGDDWIENSVYRITLDRNGDIASIRDKRHSRELVEPGKAMRLALFTENNSPNWPAWEILKATIDQEPVAVTDDVNISVVERGSVRTTLRVERRYNDSRFVQYISLTDGAADDRIDVRTDIDWRQTNALLKVEFPMNVSNPEATYDLGIGSIQRGVNTPTAYEVYAQQWADLTAPDNSYGIAVVNNCKYGWDKPSDNTIRLTLLHTPHTPHRYLYQNRQDLGHHTLTYSIIGHPSGYVDAGIVRKADALNNPLFAYHTPQHVGTLGKTFSILKVNSPQIDVKAFKKAEHGDTYIVRVYETAGREVRDAEIEFPVPIESAAELNGIEERIGDAIFRGNRLMVSASAFQPRTFAVKLARPAAALHPVPHQTVALNYNFEGYTSDAFWEIADFDRKGNSYSFDLLPDRLTCEGTEFEFGNIGRKNMLQCKGDTILLPANHTYRTLYVLAASSDQDKTVPFRVDGRSYERFVPYYSDFVGQWGWDENKGYMKEAKVAYAGTHRHNKTTGNQPYVFTYMFEIALPLEAGSRMVVLPDDPTVTLFAASLSEEEAGRFAPAAEFRVLP